MRKQHSFNSIAPAVLLASYIAMAFTTGGAASADSLNDSQILGIYIQVNGFDIETALLADAQAKSESIRKLANRVAHLLGDERASVRLDWGLDHGTWTVLHHMIPAANVPVVQLSIDGRMSPAGHLELGRALGPLRDEGVLIMGSGLTYHNMGGFGRSQSTAVAHTFEGYLNTAINASDAGMRNDMLTHWEQAPDARLAHPRVDHLITLMVIAGAAGDDTGQRLFVDHVMSVVMASYVFGSPTLAN